MSTPEIVSQVVKDFSSLIKDFQYGEVGNDEFNRLVLSNILVTNLQMLRVLDDISRKLESK